MKDTWLTRELPVLESIVQYFEEEPTGTITSEEIAVRAAMSHDEVHRALTKLGTARPPFFGGIVVDMLPYPVRITEVTERALTTVGQWPNPEALVDQLIEAISRAGDAEMVPERKDMLRRTVDTLRGAAYQILLGWVTGSLPHP
jgi:hypothetical protein